MSDKSRKQLESDFIYPSLEEVVITQLENIDNKVTNIEPIYFDPNILCCPYCGNTEVIKGGRRKEKQHYICKKCEVKFIDPKQRQKKPNRKFPKRNNDKYFDSDVLCCPSCGSKKFRSVGINRSGKQTYICEETKCSRRFIEPKLRQIRTKIEGVKCRFCSSDDFRKSGIDTRSKKQLYFCLSCKRRFTLNAKIDPMVLPLSEDVWDAQALGLKVIKTSTITKINFTKIHQPWLKELAKNFVKFTSATRALGTISNYVDSIKSFSNFLSEYHPEITEIEQINRNLILEYISHLKTKNLAINTLRGHIGNFKVFLDTGNQNKWFKTDRYLIIEGDRPKKSKTKPRYIPKYVKQQLNKHLDKLPKPLARMVLVIQECGMRYSSLGTISFDCLEYVGDDPLGNQQWSIKFYDEKLKQDIIIPISLELVEIVKQQQSFIREHCGDDNEYLFTARRIGTNKCEFKPAKNKIMKLTSFCGYLDKLAVSHNIQDENGKLWRFESHQFRHNVGTEMINQADTLSKIIELWKYRYLKGLLRI